MTVVLHLSSGEDYLIMDETLDVIVERIQEAVNEFGIDNSFLSFEDEKVLIMIRHIVKMTQH